MATQRWPGDDDSTSFGARDRPAFVLSDTRTTWNRLRDVRTSSVACACLPQRLFGLVAAITLRYALDRALFAIRLVNPRKPKGLRIIQTSAPAQQELSRTPTIGLNAQLVT